MTTKRKEINPLDISFKEFMPGQIIQSIQFNDDMNDIEEKVNELIDDHNVVSKDLYTHIEDKDNPHNVDAHQTGTYYADEIDEFIQDVKSGNLYDNAITNRVLDDDCVDNRNIIDGSITYSKLDNSIGNQLDISQNISITDRYTKEETDLLIQEKVGDGTYDKETIDEKLEQIQAGQILDKSISIHQLKDDVGRRLDISNNPDIINKYTREEVDLLIRNNALPRDWGSILEEDVDIPVEIPTKEITLPVANHMKVNTCIVSESSILDVDIQENVDARGEFNTVGERLNSFDSQIKEIAIQITSNGIDDTEQLKLAISKYNQVMVIGELIISDSITMKKGVKLYGNNINTSRLKLLNDVDFIYTTGNSEICDLTLIVPKNYTKDCLSSKSYKMDSVDNGKVHDLNILQDEDSNLPLGTAIKLESSSNLGGSHYFTNFNYYNIDIKGYWENGIKTNIIYNTVNDKTWLNVIKMSNIFINTAKNIIVFDYENNTGSPLNFPLGNCLAEHIYSNVSGQYIENKTEKFLIAKNIRMSKFDYCIPWDFNTNVYEKNIKPYDIYCDTKVKIELNGLMYSSNPIDVIEFKNGESDNVANLNNHVPSYSIIDGINKNVRNDIVNTFTKTQNMKVLNVNEYLSVNKIRTARENNPDSLSLEMTSFKPIYYLANDTSSNNLDVHFMGLRFDSNNALGGTDRVYSYDIGIDGSNRLVYRAKYQNNWSRFFRVISEKYFPNGSTSSRPSASDINVGYMYFDTSKGKPIWWNGVAWVDAMGNGI